MDTVIGCELNEYIIEEISVNKNKFLPNNNDFQHGIEFSDVYKDREVARKEWKKRNEEILRKKEIIPDNLYANEAISSDGYFLIYENHKVYHYEIKNGKITGDKKEVDKIYTIEENSEDGSFQVMYPHDNAVGIKIKEGQPFEIVNKDDGNVVDSNILKKAHEGKFYINEADAKAKVEKLNNH